MAAFVFHSHWLHKTLSALGGKIKPTQMWRRERANVTHAIIQNVIPVVQGDFREELAIVQKTQ